MANILHRTTLEHRISVNTPEYPDPPWLEAPDLSAVEGVDQKYWKISGDVVSEMSAAEKTVVDDAEAAAIINDNRTVAIAVPDDSDSVGVRVRELIEVFNKRDNYLVNRIVELHGAMAAMKASTGGVANLRAAVPSSFLATNTRSRADAVQDYKDDIAAGGAD